VGACSVPAPPPAPPANLQPVEVAIDSGRLRGRSDGSLAYFKNIPFAAPPVGALRWRPPAPPAAWSGVRDAGAYGNDCMQNRMSWDKAITSQPLSEDCLYLNVWTPAPLPAKPDLPVMVWIYGGGDASGSANSPATEGDRLAARGAVVVAFNYRIGRFGFFAHPALTAESPDGPLGNYGFMDQVAALQWVRRNIRAFGGDPAKVTLFGESAGGDAVLKLMLNPLARGLFAKVICESAGGNFLLPRLHEDLPDLPAAEKLGVAFADDVGIQGEPLAALRALPAKKVLGGISLIEWEKKTWSGPMIDGRLVTSDVAAGFAAGQQAKLPLIIGSNSDELGAIPWIFRGSMVKALYPRFKGRVDDVIAAYGGQDPFDARVLNDFVFNEPAHYVAYHSSATQPTYLYRFSYVAESKRKDLKGAPHASETFYVFDHLEVTGDKISDADRQMARHLGDYWLAFARTGIPHVDGDPSWPAYSAANDLLFDFTTAGEATAKADAPWLDAIARFVH
jgi:para-nitrobenzyl esterase